MRSFVTYHVQTGWGLLVSPAMWELLLEMLLRSFGNGYSELPVPRAAVTVLHHAWVLSPSEGVLLFGSGGLRE